MAGCACNHQAPLPLFFLMPLALLCHVRVAMYLSPPPTIHTLFPSSAWGMLPCTDSAADATNVCLGSQGVYSSEQPNRHH